MNLAFSGDCYYTIQRHFIDRTLDSKPIETNSHEYLKTLAVLKTIYESASKNITVSAD